MKRIYTILSCLLLAGMLCIGLYALLDKDATYSESERRKLKTRPKLTFSAMLDGSYASDYRDYFADTFPNREKLMNANRSLNGFYYFSGGSKDGAQLVINMNGGAANHGEALPSTDDTTPSSSTQPSGTATDSTEPTEPTQPTQTQDPDAAAEELGSVLVVGDRAMEVPYGDKDTIRSYADAVNDIAAKLGSGVRTFSIAVPNAAAFYAPAENQHMLQTDMIAACYDRLKELKSTAIAVDAYSKLEAHKDEYLYFRSDHHWTALGAYYAYTAFCESAGLKAEPLSKFESGEYTGFLGSLYSAIKAYPQSQALADNPDTVQFWRPFVDLDTKWYPDAEFSMEYFGGTLCKVDDTSNKYLTFLGGDHPITVIKTNVDGPVCMILKEQIEPVKGLILKANFGIDRQYEKRKQYLPKTTMYGEQANGQASISQSDNNDYLMDLTATYMKDFGNHSLTVLAGYSFQQFNSEWVSAGNQDFITDGFLYNNLGAGNFAKPSVGSGASKTSLGSYFGRINYSYLSRYLLTLTMRADGASNFDPDNRWGFFPSVSAGWRFSDEPFMASLNDVVSNGKLRISYGQTGNSNVGNRTMNLYNTGYNNVFGNTIHTGVLASQLGNPNLTWETTKEFNVGLDLGFINNRISLSMEYFNRTISDLLVKEKSLPSYNEVTSIASNIGETKSQGFEMTLNTVNIDNRDWTWTTDLTLSLYRDRWKERDPNWKPAAYQKEDDWIRSMYSFVSDGLMQPGEERPKHHKLPVP